jgi:hypothetical protein
MQLEQRAEISSLKVWGTIASEIDTMDNHMDNIRSNFSGEYSFSNDKFASIAADHLISIFGSNKTHCDIGASIASLSEKLNAAGWDSYSIDGCAYGLKNGMIRIPRIKYAVVDFRKDISPLFQLKNKFDISTAFEVTEHIPKNDISRFIENIAKISKKLVCSVHFGGEEQGSHYNIRPTQWWVEFLSGFGKVAVLHDMRQLFPFEESDFIMVEFND